MSKSRWLLFALVLSCVISFTGCIGCYEKVPAGNVGVKVNTLGGEKGVDSKEVGVGWVWIGMFEELYLFPTFKQNYVWTADEREESPMDESISFQTCEGLSVNADIGVTYSVDPKKVAQLFQKYRRGIDEITKVFIRNYVRDTFNVVGAQYKVETVYGTGKEKLIKEVNERIKAQLEPDGIIIERIYLIGDFRLPKSVIEALNMKIEAIQRSEQKEYELREALAEAKKTVATAQAEAEVMRLKTQKLTPLYLEMLRIEKWDGAYPQIMMGNGGGIIQVPPLQMREKKAAE